VQYVRGQLGMQVCAIARLADLLLFLEQNGEEGMRSHHEKVLAYRQLRRQRGVDGLSKSAWIVGGVLLATLGADWARAQAPGTSGGIYTCVDRNGRRLTADRPIAECLDREQRELGPSGIVRRQIGPSLTEQERAAQEAQRRKEAEARARELEERRRERVLTARYPDKATHDVERAAPSRWWTM